MNSKRIDSCEWHEDADGLWETECGHTFQCDTGTPSENRFAHCCYCGDPLHEVPYTESEDGV